MNTYQVTITARAFRTIEIDADDDDQLESMLAEMSESDFAESVLEQGGWNVDAVDYTGYESA